MYRTATVCNCEICTLFIYIEYHSHLSGSIIGLISILQRGQGINLFEDSERKCSLQKNLPLMYEKEVFVLGLFLRSRFYFLSVLYFPKVFMISRGM